MLDILPFDIYIYTHILSWFRERNVTKNSESRGLFTEVRSPLPLSQCFTDQNRSHGHNGHSDHHRTSHSKKDPTLPKPSKATHKHHHGASVSASEYPNQRNSSNHNGHASKLHSAQPNGRDLASVGSNHHENLSSQSFENPEVRTSSCSTRVEYEYSSVAISGATSLGIDISDLRAHQLGDQYRYASNPAAWNGALVQRSDMVVEHMPSRSDFLGQVPRYEYERTGYETGASEEDFYYLTGIGGQFDCN